MAKRRKPKPKAQSTKPSATGSNLQPSALGPQPSGSALDPRHMRPVALVRLLNSTPRGEVISERQLRRHRERAGYAIGDDRTIDLFRYAAWLTLEYVKATDPDAPDLADSYLAAKKAQAIRNREAAAAAQDIGEIPAVVNPKRRSRAEASLLKFCEIYFKEVFYLPWSDDHLLVIRKIEKAVRSGGLFAIAMPRGSGKTKLCQMAVLWAGLTGIVPFVCLIAASATKAVELMDSFKTWLETNPLLMEDFPEVCFPIRKLERIANRQLGQKHLGVSTRIEWTSDRLVLPTIPGSKASGVVLSCSGMEGSRIRGQSHTRPDGKDVRPQLVLIDDPQTRESAKSPIQCAEREKILAGDVLGMAGPDKKISGLMTCTVIYHGDLADRMLDREKHPGWQGERRKMVYAFPSNDKLWSQYAEIRAVELRNDGDGKQATSFYRKNRRAMDIAAKIAWPARKNVDELSAIQHAMNLKLRDEGAFFAEYQNEPLVVEDAVEMLTDKEIVERLSRVPRGKVPIECGTLSAYIDVHDKLLYWMVTAWASNFTGSIIDYGVWPEQPTRYFALRQAKRNLRTLRPGQSMELCIYHGLEQITDKLLSAAWIRQNDDAELHIDRCLIDANWGDSTDTVKLFCRQSSHAATLMPAHGRYFDARKTPIEEYHRQPGEKFGTHWLIPTIKGRRSNVRHVLIDTNYWKSFVHQRLAVEMGGAGALTLYGTKENEHQLLSEHLIAEKLDISASHGRMVDVWTQIPNRDNHWFDCLVGSAVAASMLGIALMGKPKAKRKRIDFGEWQRQARAGK